MTRNHKNKCYFLVPDKYVQEDNLKQRPSHKPDSIKLTVLPFNSFSPFKNFSLTHHNQNAVSYLTTKHLANFTGY